MIKQLLIILAIIVFALLFFIITDGNAQQTKGPATADQIKQELIGLQQQVNRINDRYKAFLYDAREQADNDRALALAPIQKRGQELQAQLKALQVKPVEKLQPKLPASPAMKPGSGNEPCVGEDCK